MANMKGKTSLFWAMLDRSIFLLLLTLLLAACGGGGGGGSDAPPLPAAPAGVGATAGNGQVTISWNPVAGATSYTLYLASQSGIGKNNWNSLPNGLRQTGVTTPHLQTGLSNGTTYYFVVTAVNASGESAESVEVFATPQEIPAAPTGVRVTAGNGQITIRWNPVAGASSYNLYRATVPGVTKTNYATLAGGLKNSAVTNPQLVTGLANNKIYFFVVTAVNAQGESAESLQIAAMPLTAGWFWQLPQLSGNTMSRVEFVDALHGWAVGAAGTVLHTSNGTNWERQTSGTTSFLSDVDFVDAQHGWAVGGGGAYNQTYATILHTTDGGANWTIQANGTGPNLNGVTFVDAANGWAVGDNGTILHTGDGGATWTPQASNTTEYLWKVAFADALTGWVVGGNGYTGVVLSTINGGATWTSQSFWGTQLFDVTFPTATRGWMVDVAQTDHIFATNDGGTTWGALPASSGAYLRGIHFADNSSGWAVGTFGTILHSSNGGGSWAAQDSGTTRHLNGVKAVDGQQVWTVGGNGAILHTTDSGMTWTEPSASIFPGTSALTSVSFANAGQGWVVGRSILHTIDGGSNWTTQVATTADTLWDVDFVDALNGWAVGDGSQILHTSDGGTNWNPQNSNGATQLWGVDFVDANTGWAVGPSGDIAATVDGGATWLIKNSGTPLFEVSAVSPTTAWAVGSGGRILKTTNGGDTWVAQLSGTQIDLRAIFAIDANRAWAVGGVSSNSIAPILATTDGGDTWSAQNTVTTGWFNGVVFADAVTGWVVNAEGMIFATTDGGAHWVRQTSPTDQEVFGITAISPTTAWAVGWGIMKTTTGGF